jgi:pepF/M3 family oligoendopeptidase
MELPRWDLTPLFASLDDRDFSLASERVVAGLARLTALHDRHDVRGGAPRPATAGDRTVLAELLGATNEVHEELRRVNAYLYARVTTDARDDAAADRQAELQMRTAALGVLGKRFEAWVARLGAEDLLTGAAPVVGDHRFVVTRAASSADHQLSEAEESLAAELRLSGSSAWARLHRDVTARLTARVGGEDVPMSVVRGRATDPDPAVRRAAYEAELAAWETVAVPLAAALNGAKGEASVLNRRRGWPDDLAPALHQNNVDRATVDALNEAVTDSLGDFRRYLRAKAAHHGHQGGLPWWDLFAPITAGPRHGPAVTWDQALTKVTDAFSTYSPVLADLVRRAVDERWLDAEPRDGKVGGAYCLPIGGGVSRVLLNFDGSFDGVQTLAHELGHAYHNTNLGQATALQRQTPMALAETASIFCETIMVDAGLAAAGPAERLALLDTDLQGATQVVVDIRSRFLFESELCRRRATRTLSVGELSDLMLDSQEQAYGDGLHPDHRHPFMWAVKGHYYTPFYNWPYTFGLLFGIGLHRRFEEDPERFRAGYDELLASTGLAPAGDLAARFGIDIRSADFWASSLDVLRGRIADFEALARPAHPAA